MGYVKNILVAIDQVGNAIAGGNPDCTISGRIGYFSYNSKRPFVWYWNLLAFIVDLTFYPFDDHKHCQQAYMSEKLNDFHYTDNIILLFLLSVITMGSCLILIPINWTFYCIRFAYNKIAMK